LPWRPVLRRRDPSRQHLRTIGYTCLAVLLLPFAAVYAIMRVVWDIIFLLLAFMFAPLLVWLPQDSPAIEMLGLALIMPWNSSEEAVELRVKVVNFLGSPIILLVWLALLLVLTVVAVAWNALLLGLLWATLPLSFLLCSCRYDVSQLLTNAFVFPWSLPFTCAHRPFN
jgi:hypothetical protein